jgi:LGFP repeat
MKSRIASLIAASAFLILSMGGCKPSPRWGYLANSGSPVPIKGTYFFTGDAWPDRSLYTFAPVDARHLFWSSDPYAPAFVVDTMKSVGINVVVMSYWGSDQISSAPMKSTEEAGDLLFDTAAKRHILVLPSIEVADGLPNHYAQGDFVKMRLVSLINRYLLSQKEHPSWPAVWAKVYDQDGQPRYAVQLIGVASNKAMTDDAFVSWLDTLAKSVLVETKMPVGFMIDPGLEDPMKSHGNGYTPRPKMTPFQNARSFLAIQGFISEIQTPGIPIGNATPYFDNNGLLPFDHPVGAGNAPNREQIAAQKRKRLAGWIDAGLPVVIDVNPGFDGRYTWGGVIKNMQSCTTDSDCPKNGCNVVGGDRCACNASDMKCHSPNGYWGDNASYYDDFYRNYMSQLRGMGNVGITFNSWNQYTEGSVAVPSERVPLKDKPPQGTGYWDSVQFNWLKDMYAADPRQCSHVHYVNGGASKFWVFGAICERWQAFGQDGLPPSVTYGAPTTSEMDTPGRRGKMNRFSKDQRGSAIYWSSGATKAYEVHGGIYLKYLSLREDISYLGLPTTDELPSTAWCSGGRYNAFQGGWIDWCPDGTVWAHSDPTQGSPGRPE